MKTRLLVHMLDAQCPTKLPVNGPQMQVLHLAANSVSSSNDLIRERHWPAQIARVFVLNFVLLCDWGADGNLGDK